MSRHSRPRGERRAAEFFGIILVVIGGVLLLRSAGLIDLDWGAIWAIVLVTAGVVILVGALRPRGGRNASVVTLPRDRASRLELDIGVGAGSFTIRGGARDLVEVHSTDDDVSASVDRRDGVARVRIRQRADWFPFGWTGPYSWDVRVAEDVPTALALSGGAGDFTVDLSGLRIVDATISAGAAQLRLILPRPLGEVRMKVSAGAASVVVQVPPGVEARFTTSGLMSIEGRNETPGFASARDRVLVAVSGGVSSLRIV